MEKEWVSPLIPMGNEAALEYRTLFMHFHGIYVICPRSPIVVDLETTT
jgi:hypothetical protein